VSDERPSNRWLEASVSRGDDYDERFARLEKAGQNVHGEADFVESFSVRSVLDAGCGTGRVAIELARRGLDVVGVDADPAMLATARRNAPSLSWIESDLTTVVLGRVFDLVVLAGNVMIFVRPGTEGPVLVNLTRHLEARGLLIAGFTTGAGLDLPTYDQLADAAGLTLVERWATWSRAPAKSDRTYAVSVHRRRSDGPN
jgi:trans-aconitate methyltransferase